MSRIMRPCLTCRRLIPQGPSRCTECQRAEWRRQNRQRPPHERAIYSSQAWRKLAEAVVAGATRCAWCGAFGAKLSADHISPIRVAPELALDPVNVVAACRGCQERRKVRPGAEPQHVLLGARAHARQHPKAKGGHHTDGAKRGEHVRTPRLRPGDGDRCRDQKHRCKPKAESPWPRGLPLKASTGR